MQEYQRKAYDLKTFCSLFSIGRTKVYEEIKNGRLVTKKVGRRTLVSAEAADQWLHSLKSSG